MNKIEILPANRDLPFDEVVEVFGVKGDASRCFCQFFCDSPAEFKASRRHNIEKLRGQVEEGTPGLMAYREGSPVGWVQVGPLEQYPRFRRTAKYDSTVPEPPPSTWAVTCFVVTVGNRQDGVASALLDAAIDFAQRSGAQAIDAHPIDLRASNSRTSSSELYVGVLSLFTRRGFRTVGRPSPRRPIVRRRLEAIDGT